MKNSYQETYSDSDLMSKALQYLKDAYPAKYRELKKNKKELEAYLKLKAKNTRQTAESNVNIGLSEEEAWRRAINQEIYENRID